MKKSQILQFRLHFCRNCKFLFLYIEGGPRVIFRPFSDFFWTLEQPHRGEIVFLLNAWFEKILGRTEQAFLAVVVKNSADDDDNDGNDDDDDGHDDDSDNNDDDYGKY